MMVSDHNSPSKGINNSDIRDLDLTLSFNKDEYEFMKAMTSLLAKMDMDDKGHTAIKEDNFTDLIPLPSATKLIFILNYMNPYIHWAQRCVNCY
jgi:hypothetical protein